MIIHDLYPAFKDTQPHPHHPVPYTKPLTLSIHEHAPADPYGHGYLPTPNCPSKASRKTLNQHSKLSWCLLNKLPPLKTNTAKHSHQLHIISQIACGDTRGAQLVRCHLDSDRNATYVAKIYDPLYYDFVDRLGGEEIPVDVAWLAEHDYRREAAVYAELKRCRQDGRFTPKYFGSWIFDMVLGGEERPVHMILLEELQGCTMFALLESREYLKLCLRLRLDVFAQVLEAAATLRFYNIAQDDLAPRNVMLTGLDFASQSVERVVLFDFNEAVVLTHHKCPWRLVHERMERPTSPRYQFWSDFPYEFQSWVYPLFQRKDTFRCWLLSRWGGGETFGGFAESERGSSKYGDYEEPPPLRDDELDDELVDKLNKELNCDWRRFV